MAVAAALGVRGGRYHRGDRHRRDQAGLAEHSRCPPGWVPMDAASNWTAGFEFRTEILSVSQPVCQESATFRPSSASCSIFMGSVLNLPTQVVECSSAHWLSASRCVVAALSSATSTPSGCCTARMSATAPGSSRQRTHAWPVDPSRICLESGSVGITLFRAWYAASGIGNGTMTGHSAGIVLHRRIGRSIRRLGFRLHPTTSGASVVSKPCPEMRPVRTRAGFTERTRTPYVT